MQQINKGTGIRSAMLLFALLLVSACNIMQGQAQKKKKGEDVNTFAWRYEVNMEGVGSGGTYIIKVFSYSKKPDLAIEQAKKNAVHAVIFKGVENGRNVKKQPPIAGDKTNLYYDHREFFDDFFADGGKYMQFVSMSDDGSIDPRNRLKVGKEYKIGVIVAVNTPALRKDLEEAGVINGIMSGFSQ